MTPQDYPLHPAAKPVLLFPLLIGVLVPLGVIAGLVVNGFPQQQLPGVALSLLLMPVIGAGMAWNLLHLRVRLSDAGLRIRTLPCPRTIPIADMDLERAEIADLNSRSDLMPVFKIAGTRLPGYRAGLFRLGDKRRASVLLTELRRVLVLPRRDGRVLLLSVERPEALLQALRSRR
ncbi:MAG: PH domain-containing protein [Arenimonas sp.]